MWEQGRMMGAGMEGGNRDGGCRGRDGGWEEGWVVEEQGWMMETGMEGGGAGMGGGSRD